jgi:hypothetical protein
MDSNKMKSIKILSRESNTVYNTSLPKAMIHQDNQKHHSNTIGNRKIHSKKIKLSNYQISG